MEISFRYEGGVKNWIHRVKSGWRFEAWREFQSSYLPQFDYDFDAVVPVASDPNLMTQRVFDPTRELAVRIARLVGKPLWDSVFKRQKFWKSQKEMSVHERLTILKYTVGLDPRFKAFVGNYPEGSKPKVLLVDDVMTTGASLQWYSELLKPYCTEVHCYVLARAPLIS